MNSLQVVRVFLASPGDLSEERRAAKASVDEINRTVARPAGYHVDLIGWEDTLSSAGRPQAIINEDLQTCQMFIGMLWARWGTPPDAEGHFSSGFEEEFNLASEGNANRGKPHISLFFKDVDPSKVADPGPELSKVLAFKERVIAEKLILFDTFADIAAFAQKVRLSIADFIHKLDRSTSKKAAVSSQRPKRQSSSSNQAASSNENRDPESDFLRQISSQIRVARGQDLSSVQVARLRNIGLTLARSENDNTVLGTHDSNLIYEAQSSLRLSAREMSGLADAGLEALPSESTPVWSWIARNASRFSGWLTYSTLIGPDQRRIGAFNAMSTLKASIVEDEQLKRADLERIWFGEGVSDAIRNAALEYIGVVGLESFRPAAEEELARNSYATRTRALETILLLLAQHSVQAAASYAVEASFDEISKAALTPVLSGFRELTQKMLEKSLDHRSDAIRAKGIETLAKRGTLDEGQARRFFGDASLEVRKTVVAACESMNIRLSLEELKKALILENAQGGMIRLLGGYTNYDSAGHEAYADCKRARLSRKPLDVLDEALRTETIDTEETYLALVQGHFQKVSERARRDFDDRFEHFLQAHLELVRNKFRGFDGLDSIVESIGKNKALSQRQLMRGVLSVFVAKSGVEDIDRIRKAFAEDAVDPREEDINYFMRCGTFEDILLIAKLAGDYRINPGAGLLSMHRKHLCQAGKAIVKLAEGRLSELFAMDLDVDILAMAIANIPLYAFRRIPPAVVEQLLFKDSDKVRKATSIQILRSHSRKNAKDHLQKYIKASDYRFYNVIFWLDLCRAFTKEVYIGIAHRENHKMLTAG